MARRKSGGVEETYNVLWQASGHFAWICAATQEGSNKAKHEKAGGSKGRNRSKYLGVNWGQYWLLGIDHWLPLKTFF